MGIDFQLVSSYPHTVHFFRILTVVPSCPTITAPLPAVARARRGGGSPGAGGADTARSGGVETGAGTTGGAGAGAGGKRCRTSRAGTPCSTPSFHTVSLGTTFPAAASPASC